VNKPDFVWFVFINRVRIVTVFQKLSVALYVSYLFAFVGSF